MTKLPRATWLLFALFALTGCARTVVLDPSGDVARQQGDLIVVTDGLKAGEQIVTSGLLKLRNDAEVTINDAIQPSADASPTPENR